MKQARHDNLSFFRGVPTAIIGSLPFWLGAAYIAYRLLKLFGY